MCGDIAVGLIPSPSCGGLGSPGAEAALGVGALPPCPRRRGGVLLSTNFVSWLSQASQRGIPQPCHIALAFSGGRDDPFDHDFVNHIRLPGVFQFLARSIERPADGANCRIIENTYGNEPKNRQQVHATPPRVSPAGPMLLAK